MTAKCLANYKLRLITRNFLESGNTYKYVTFSMDIIYFLSWVSIPFMDKIPTFIAGLFAGHV
jgi:hypothetical protein